MNTLLSLLKISRPGFWATSMWFYLLPLGGHDVFAMVPFWIGLAYVGFPLGLMIYGWNDMVDTETDRHNPRKGTYLFGAQPSDEELARLPLAITVAQIPFFLLFCYFIGLQSLWLLAGLIAFSWIYNSRRVGFKNYPFVDLLNQCGYLFVFVLSSWLNGAPQLSWPVFIFGALFAMHSHLLGATMDIEPDRAAGRRTTACVLGPVGAKFLIAAFLLIESGLIAWHLQNIIIAVSLAVGAAWFILDSLVIWQDKPYSKRMMAAFLLGWNAIAMISAPWIWRTAAFVDTI